MLRTVVLERGMPGGELLNTEKLDDWIGEKSILGWELAQKFEEHSRLFGAEYVTANVTTVRRTDGGTFETITDTGEVFKSPAVIITAGGTPIKLGIPGEAEYAGKGVSYCAICDGAFFRNQRIAVVGGGDAAVEEATFSRATPRRCTSCIAATAFARRRSAGASVRQSEDRGGLEHVAEEIVGDEQGLMKALRTRNLETGAMVRST
jgi:thioredoxin reductase (NADPH)